MKHSVPRVGVAAVVRRSMHWTDSGAEGTSQAVLLGKRKGSHGAGTWSFPGGHLEHGESVIQAVMRELWEEVGYSASIHAPSCAMREGMHIVGFTNDIFREERLHYVTIYVLVQANDDFEPTLCEPEKCECWEWFHPARLPSPLFLPLENARKHPVLEALLFR